MCLLWALTAVGACGDSRADDAFESEIEDFTARERTITQYYEAMVECMTESGVPMRLLDTRDGMVAMATSGGSDLAEGDAYVRCDDMVGGAPPPPPLPSRDLLSRLYEANLDVVDCLQQHSHPFTEPPSAEVYIDTYLASYSGGVVPWAPYGGLAGPQALEDCPEPGFSDLSG